MASVQDMIEMAELLKVKVIGVDEDRCVRVRNRNSTCSKCTDACIRDAITTARNEVSIDESVCVNCGACVAVCPTSALYALEPSEGEVISRICGSADVDSGMAVVACARKASHHEVRAERFAEVPCLGHMTEQLLLDVVDAGFDDVILVDGDCATCKYGAASKLIDDTVDVALRLLEACDSQAMITRTNAFPPELFEQGVNPSRNFRGEDRRGLLFQTGGYVRKVATNVARKTINDKLGGPDANKPKTLKDRLGAGKSGKMPSFTPDVNFAILDVMERVAKRSGAEDILLSDEQRILNTRHFGSISIDCEKCSGCGLCVLFCPTEALQHAQFDTPSDESKKYLEFQTSQCVQCGMCEDVCIRKCLSISPKVRVVDLYGFEPELVEINKPEERFSIFDYKQKQLDRNPNSQKLRP